MQSPGDTSRHDQSRAVSQDQPSRAKLRRRSSSKRVLGVGVALCVPALGLGLAACGGTSSSAAATTSSAAATPASPSTGSTGSGGGSNVRSTNAAGGSLGEVTGVSGSSFTVSTQGVNVTVKETSSTVYDKGTSGAAASAVTKGTTVLVIGRVDNKTITATQVIVGPAINLSTASANVIAFRTPNESESKSVGQIPASYKQGSGTIVSGAAATKATEAALTSYAGGVVDRVVRLSNGEYEVHNIGVNWPHHIFVTSDYKVVGAND
jgi:hypothetical protein